VPVKFGGLSESAKWVMIREVKGKAKSLRNGGYFKEEMTFLTKGSWYDVAQNNSGRVVALIEIIERQSPQRYVPSSLLHDMHTLGKTMSSKEDNIIIHYTIFLI